MSYKEISREKYDQIRGGVANGTTPFPNDSAVHWKSFNYEDRINAPGRSLYKTELWWITAGSEGAEVVSKSWSVCSVGEEYLCSHKRMYPERNPYVSYVLLRDGRAFEIERMSATYGDGIGGPNPKEANWMLQQFPSVISSCGTEADGRW